MIFTSDAIVLKRTALANNDILLTLFTLRTGKMMAVAQGARHPKNRLASASNPFVYGKFFLLTGSGMSKINGVDIEKSFYSIRENIVKLAYGAWFLELTDLVIVEGEQNIDLFMELKLCLSRLADMDVNTSTKDVEVLKMAYEWTLLSKIGLAPLISNCTICSEDIVTSRYFSCESGGMICEACSNQIEQENSIRKQKKQSEIKVYKMGDTIPKILEFLLTKSVDEILNQSFHETYVKKLDTLAYEYLKYHLGVKQFKSRAFLKDLGKGV